MNTKFMCECNSSCTLKAEASEEHLEKYLALFRRPVDEIDFIVDGCLEGPMPGTTLIEKGNGYSLYRKEEAS